MNSDEIDKIIAEAVADSKNHKGSKIRGKKSSDKILLARKVLNWTFMTGFVVAVVVYFAFPEQKALFFSVGFGSVLLKLVEFYLRFMF